jgi:hypothetical protein
VDSDRLLRYSPSACCLQVLDYDNVQQTLLPLLSRAYSLVFMVSWAAGRASWRLPAPFARRLGMSIAPGIPAAARLPSPHLPNPHLPLVPLSACPPAGAVDDGNVR